jgi:hypothetical protein
MRLLTSEEVESLPDGTPILMTWDGQKEPKSFTVERDQWDGIRAVFYIPKQNFPPEKVTMKDPLPSVLYQVYLAEDE